MGFLSVARVNPDIRMLKGKRASEIGPSGAVWQQRVLAVYRQSPSTLLLTLLMVPFIAWRVVEATHRFEALPWLAITVVVALFRFGLGLRFAHVSHDETSIRRWGGLYVLGALAMGACWGKLGLGFPGLEAEERMMLMMAALVIVAASLLSHMQHFGAFASFSFAVYAGFLIGILDMPAELQANLLSVGIFSWLILLLISHRLSRAFGEQCLAHVDAEQARAAANQASEAKSSFLASMSHEIRTPLNAIIGFTGLLQQTSLQQLQQTYVDTLKMSGEQLLYLINDILDLSRIEAGELPLEEAVFSPLECLESSLDFVATQAERKGLCLSLTYAGSLDARVRGDFSRLRQVVVNLLANAVKFTDAGAVSCHLRVVCEEDRAHVHIAVADTGVGMDQPTVARLFRPLSQADVSTSRRFGGTGLGLSISHRLLELMGGEFTVTSEKGLGSKFHFELLLPWADVESNSLLPACSPLAPMRVGVLVKPAEIRSALRRQMTEFGYELVDIDSDLHLLSTPGLDALVLCKPLLQGVSELTPYPRARNLAPLGLIVLQGIDEGVCLTTGKHGQRIVCMERILKPSRLRSALDALYVADDCWAERLQKSPNIERSDRPAGVRRRASVLVVDDNAVNQILTRVKVESLGYPCQVVSSGIDALAAMDVRAFDIVLMDLEMPEMDGFTTTEAIRTRPVANPGAPYVIAVSAHASRDIAARIEASGMDDYVSKPVMMTKLHEALARAEVRLATSG